MQLKKHIIAVSFKGVRRQTLIHYEWKGNGTKGANIKWKLLLCREKRRI